MPFISKNVKHISIAIRIKKRDLLVFLDQGFQELMDILFFQGGQFYSVKDDLFQLSFIIIFFIFINTNYRVTTAKRDNRIIG